MTILYTKQTFSDQIRYNKNQSDDSSYIDLILDFLNQQQLTYNLEDILLLIDDSLKNELYIEAKEKKLLKPVKFY